MAAADSTYADRTEQQDDRARWIALIVLCVGMLMIVLDVTVVNALRCRRSRRTSASRNRASPGSSTRI